MIRFICFDLDGTLLDTLGGIASASNRALGAMGLPAWPEAAYRDFIGLGPRYLASRVLPGGGAPEQAERWLELYKEFYRENGLAARPFPGVLSTLRALRAAGAVLAVLSNKPHELVTAQIERVFPGLFDAVQGQRDGVAPKPDPAALLGMAAAAGFLPEECAYVGDMSIDVETARRAGFFAVGALWGFGREGLLPACDPALLAETPEDLPGAVLRPDIEGGKWTCC